MLCLILCLFWMLWVLQKWKKARNINVSCWNYCFDYHTGHGVNSVPTQGVYPVEQIRMHLSGVRALFLPSPLLFRDLGGTGQAVSFCGTSFKSCWKCQFQFQSPGVFTGLWRAEAPAGDFNVTATLMNWDLSQTPLISPCRGFLENTLGTLKQQLQFKNSWWNGKVPEEAKGDGLYRIQQVCCKLWVL